jgi:hypothetical protein
MHVYSTEIEMMDLEVFAQRMGIALYNAETVAMSTRGKFAGRLHLKLVLRPQTDAYRRVSNGRRIWAVTWEGHRDFMRELFALDSEAIVDSSLARYCGVNEFDELHDQTDYDLGNCSKVTAQTAC